MTLKDAGLKSDEAFKHVDEISEECRICKLTRKKESRLRTCAPKARECNQVVSLDLKPVSSLLDNKEDKRHILYIHDEFSRFTVGTVIKNKEDKTVVKSAMDLWSKRGMGYLTQNFQCDNGSEFKENTIELIAKRTGTYVKTTPSYSSWSNRTIERKHRFCCQKFCCNHRFCCQEDHG